MYFRLISGEKSASQCKTEKDMAQLVYKDFFESSLTRPERFDLRSLEF